MALAGDEGAGGCFDDVVGDGVELVDLQDASDLGEEAFEEAEVASGDAFDRGDGLGVGEVFGVESAAEALPVAGQDEQQLRCTKVLGQVLANGEDVRMSTSRRRYSAQFKDEAVQMVVRTGTSIAQVARDLGVNEGTLGNWVHLWKQDHPDPEPEVTEFDREKMVRIEAENRKLRMENEFLKKAAAFFARTQD